jgi:hypothetical protein
MRKEHEIEAPSPQHDRMVHQLDSWIRKGTGLHFLATAGIIHRDDPERLTAIAWEWPIKTRSRALIGFVDLVLVTHTTLVMFECKTVAYSVGALLRQLNKYREFGLTSYGIGNGAPWRSEVVAVFQSQDSVKSIPEMETGLSVNGYAKIFLDAHIPNTDLAEKS